MEPTIFEPDFDFTTYIEKRLRDIDDLTERKTAKAVKADLDPISPLYFPVCPHWRQEVMVQFDEMVIF